MQSIAFLILFTSLVINPLDGLFIRKFETYQNVAKDFSEFYHSKTIIFAHASPEQQILENIEFTTKIFKWKMFFNKLGIPTMLIHLEKIGQEYGENFQRLYQPLFIILNDYDNSKASLTKIFSSKLHVSKAKWFIFLRDEVKMEHFFENIYIPFDCEFWVSQRKEHEEIITEVYRVASGAELKQGESITWNPNTKTLFPKNGLNKRRQNLHGQSLRAVVTTSFRNDNRALMLRDWAQEWNTTIAVQAENDTGFCKENKTFYCAFNKLVYNTTDLMLLSAMASQKQFVWSYFDVSHSLTNLRYYLCIRRPESNFVRMNIFKPLKPAVWIMIVFSIVIISCTLTLVEYYLHKINHQHERYRCNIFSLFVYNFITVHGALCNQGMRHSRLTPIRIICFVNHCLAVLILASYSALIISALTSDSSSLPFTNLEGLLEDGTYDLGLINSSIKYLMMTNASLIKQILKKVSNDSTFIVNTYEDGMKLLCKREKFAFIMVNVVDVNFPSPKCIFERLDMIEERPYVVYLQLRSPYRKIINTKIIYEWESGRRAAVVTKFRSLFYKNYHKDYVGVTLPDVMPLILIVLMGIITSILVLFIERWIHYQMIKNPKIIIIPNEFIKNRKYPIHPRSSRPRSIRGRRSTQLTPKFRRIRELMLLDAKNINQPHTSSSSFTYLE